VRASERHANRARLSRPGLRWIPDNIPQIVFGSTTALPSGFSHTLSTPRRKTRSRSATSLPRRSRCPRRIQPRPSPTPCIRPVPLRRDALRRTSVSVYVETSAAAASSRPAWAPSRSSSPPDTESQATKGFTQYTVYTGIMPRKVPSRKSRRDEAAPSGFGPVLGGVDIRDVAGCSCLRLRRAARRVTALYEEILAPSGLTIAQVGLLSYLYGTWYAPRRARRQRARRVVNIDPTTLNRT